MAGENTLNFTEQGGGKSVISDGGELEVQSGGVLDIQSGATFYVHGSNWTAVEFGAIDGVTAGTASASKAVVLDASKNIATIGTIGCGAITSTGASSFASIALTGSGGAAAANMLLMGRGTSGSPATTAAADKSFVEFRTQSTATSGMSRGLYWRHELNGAGNSGESIRAFTKVKLAATVARGAHFSLDLDATGTVTGLGAGVDAQLMVPNVAVGAAGTYTVQNLEIWSSGATSDMGAVTNLSYMRVVNSGNATGMETIDDDAYLMSLFGFVTGGGHLLDSTINTTDAQIDHTLKVWVDGIGACYIGLMDTANGS